MIEYDDLISLKKRLDEDKLHSLIPNKSDTAEIWALKWNEITCIYELIKKETPKELFREDGLYRCGGCFSKLKPSERENPYCPFCGQRIKRSWE